MKKQYKVKRKRSIPVYYYIIILVIILMLMGTGYSLWSTKLYIIGNVNASYKEQKLENIDFVTQSNEQLVTVEDSYWIDAFTIENTTSFNDTTIGVEAKISISAIILTSRTATITMEFTNNNSTKLMNGTIEIVENTNNLEVEKSSITSTVESQATSTVTTVIAINRNTETSDIKYRICYTLNGIKQYAYLIIHFEK